MIAFYPFTDLYSAVTLTLLFATPARPPVANRDEGGTETGDLAGDDTEEGIDPEGGGMSGSSDGAPYEGIGVTPDSDNSSVDTGGYGDYDIGALFEGYVDGMHAVIVDKVGEGGPVWLIPTGLLNDLGRQSGMGSYDY